MHKKQFAHMNLLKKYPNNDFGTAADIVKKHMTVIYYPGGVTLYFAIIRKEGCVWKYYSKVRQLRL